MPGCEFEGWVGVAVPAATPKSIVERLYREMYGILTTPEARGWFSEVGAEPGADAPDVFAASIRAEHAKWGKLIRDGGIKLE